MEASGRGDLIESILELQSALMQQRCAMQPPPLLDIDVTMLQLKTLLILSSMAGASDSTGVRVSDLAHWLGASPATASTLLDRLVERGLVERREDPLDRRQHRSRVSPMGQALIRRFYEGTQAQSRELLAVLSDEELRAVHDALNILIHAIERLRRAQVASH